MATPVHTAPHVLGSHRRMIAVFVVVGLAIVAAVTAVLLLQSSPATTIVDDPATVGGSAPEWLQDYRFGSADTLERLG